MPTDRVHRTTLEYPKEESAAPHTSPVDRNTRSHKNPKHRRCEGRRRDLPRCRWAAAGPSRASRRPTEPPISTPGTTGVEGAGGTCRGAGGRRRGLAGLRDDATNQTTATQPHWCGGRRRDLPRCRWAAAGPGRASRRRAERSSQRGRLAGGPPPTGTHSGRGLRRPEHPWGHNETRPRPVARPRPRHAHVAPFTTAPPAIRRSCPRDPRPRRGQPRGGQRGRGTGSRTRSRHPRCGRSGSTAGRHRAHHTRRA